jgi:NitT/TauT family transport system permease protein
MTARLIDTLLLVLAALLAWQALHLLSGALGLTSPAATFVKLSELAATADFWANVAETLRALAIAAAIAAVAGVAIGVALGAHRISGEVAEPILVIFYSLPKVVLYPLLLLIFGLGLSAKVAFGALHGVFPMIIVTMNAVRQINPIYLRTARVMRLSRLDTARTVLMPAVLPELLTGLRLCVALSLLGVLVGELFASQRGLGFMLVQAMGFNDVDTITAVAVFLALIALAANAALLALISYAGRGSARSASTTA